MPKTRGVKKHSGKRRRSGVKKGGGGDNFGGGAHYSLNDYARDLFGETRSSNMVGGRRTKSKRSTNKKTRRHHKR
jgi:hypothetical protein